MSQNQHPHRSQNSPVFDHPGKDFDGKLIVAVHGMGDQTRNDFVQSIARLFSRHFACKNNQSNQVTTLPLGAWDSGHETPVDDRAIRFLSGSSGNQDLQNLAFAEVYWADVARTLEKGEYRIEEPTHWARTVVERLAQRYGGRGGLAPESLYLAGFVVEEIAETLTLLGKLPTLLKLKQYKKRDLDDILIKFLCDVQQVGDFVRQREKIRLRILHRLQELHRQHPKAEIHIIAHSEGAVVSLFSILSALKSEIREDLIAMEAANAELRSPESDRKLDFAWIHQVSSFTTLGAPIDKHIYLWPEIWTAFETGTSWTQLKTKIRWRNHYDYADPVGFELDTAREKLGDGTVKGEWGCDAFDFPENGDYGFRRYPIPGKAHIDYFHDYELFDFLIPDSIFNRRPEKPPADTPLGFFGRGVPFLLVLLLMVGAVFVFHRGLVGDHPQIDYSLSETIVGKSPEDLHASHESTVGIFGCSMLLLGTTILARILRLSKSPGMWAIAGVCFLVGAVLFWFFPGYFTLESAYHGGGSAIASLLGDKTAGIACRAWFILLSLIVTAIAWTADFFATKFRWRPIWGLRILIMSSATLLFFTLVIPRLGDDGNKSAVALLGGWIGFVVLWWLASLLFDLAFCWERYINTGRTWLDRVREASGDKPEPKETTAS